MCVLHVSYTSFYLLVYTLDAQHPNIFGTEAFSLAMTGLTSGHSRILQELGNEMDEPYTNRMAGKLYILP